MEYEITGTLGKRGDPIDEIKTAMNEIIGTILSEFEHRFTENSEVLLSIGNSYDMEYKKLQPLSTLGISLPDQNEFEVSKRFLKNEDEKLKAKDSNNKLNILSTLYKHRFIFFS